MTFSMKKQDLLITTLLYLEPCLVWVLQGFSLTRGRIQGYIFIIGSYALAKNNLKKIKKSCDSSLELC